MEGRSFRKILVANRGEIAIRVMRAANELGIGTVGVYAHEDRFSLHRFKADESYLIGEGLGPVKAYLTIDELLEIARRADCDALHPGYGFLSENPELVDMCEREGISFIGPPAAAMRALGNKISARALAEKAGTPVMPATGPLPENISDIRALAAGVGYPLMLKASWGGGGRGMRVIRSEDELEKEVTAGRREAEAAFGNGEVYLEKLVERARHVEVQLLGDSYGKIVHLYERDCTVQRRNQKVVERAPAPYLDTSQRAELCNAALRLARHANYVNAGTAEFLMDRASGAFYFIEVNPRIQVEHTVTEEVTGIDIVKAQIRIAAGGHIGRVEETGVPDQENIHLNGHALQCRITTEDPEANFIPDYGRIRAYRGATGFGIRLDGGTAYSGAIITRYYDSLLEKVTAWAPTSGEAIARMGRALREFRIRGVATNLAFVENLINHPKFKSADYTTRFIDQTDELFSFPKRRDRATRLLNFIADVSINGNPEVEGRPKPSAPPHALVPKYSPKSMPKGTRDLLDEIGAEAFSKWILAENRALVTDTTMRDGHQALLATRMRTFDMVQVAEAYAHLLPGLFSIECWGGATFDVAMRFLKECPWRRLQELRTRIPNVLLQMLIRGANGVGYTSYPDNVIREFVRQSAESGVDLFRVFDSLNWVENMKVSMEAVLETGKLLEGTICYTGDILDPERPKYDLEYYLKMAGELKAQGSHIIGIKDMSGLLKPRAAHLLVTELKRQTGLPIHLHTHDTSGLSAASVLAAVDAGVDIFDAAIDSFSGLTSQPNLGSLVEALKRSERDTGLPSHTIRHFSNYFEAVRRQYIAFESDLRCGASEVYLHEMPGGQFTNLKEQARSLGLQNRWDEIATTYAVVNQMFGDVVKVTPTSKVVGDMTLAMVSAGHTREDIEADDKEISFPDSVISFFRGELGQPPGGFPEKLQKKVLKGELPLADRPGANLAPLDLDKVRKDLAEEIGQTPTNEEFNSYLMYPSVFTEFAHFRQKNGPLEALPTDIFFYGMTPAQEITIDIEQGKTLIIRCLAIGETDEEGNAKVFFELNGHPRIAKVANKKVTDAAPKHPKADDNNPAHLASPMPGLISSVSVREGSLVRAGDLLLSIEAMKIETSLHAERDGTISRVLVSVGSQVDAKDLLLEYQV